MKININKNNLKKAIASGLLVISIAPLTACSNYNEDSDNKQISNITFDKGKHNLIEVKRSFTLFGKEGTYRLKAPEGYTVLDYDYDFCSSFEYDDYFYTNIDEVTCSDLDNFGTPRNKEKENDICDVGNHTLINIDRSLTLLGKFSFNKDLTAPDGYDIVDYDYDASDSLEFENVTYRNNKKVKLIDENNFGEVIDKEIKKDKNYYDVGEHYIVKSIRNINLLFGKDETKTITAPKGYEILDYDYDKTEDTEYETVLYRNIVPVTKVENDFGEALEDINYIDEAEVVIDRRLNLLVGFNKLQQAEEKEGYTIIDYDYDKTEDFEFETYVYKKNK